MALIERIQNQTVFAGVYVRMNGITHLSAITEMTKKPFLATISLEERSPHQCLPNCQQFITSTCFITGLFGGTF